MKELTDGGGVRSGDEEDGGEELEDEHGDVGDVSTGWLASSKESIPGFISPSVGSAPLRMASKIGAQTAVLGEVFPTHRLPPRLPVFSFQLSLLPF
jgi:hypothetical protein